MERREVGEGLSIIPTWQEGKELSPAGDKVYKRQSLAAKHQPAPRGGNGVRVALGAVEKKLLPSGHLGIAGTSWGALRALSLAVT